MLKFTVSLAVCGLFASAAIAAAVPPELSGQWQVEIIGFAGKAETPAATIEINEDGSYAGFSGCNRFSGTLKVDQQAIEFAPPAVTKMMCAPAAMEQETQFLARLNGGLSFQRDGVKGILISRELQDILRLKTPSPEVELTIRVPGTEKIERHTTRYLCGEQKINVEYINSGPVSLAVLMMERDFVIAANVPTGSGARYVGGQYAWWSKGEEVATFYDLRPGENSAGVACAIRPQ